mmetsp:Transcript_51920/g.149696  ORF Transcript_51920/g.149696 Transcript_51920/m.149696 type:complete len:213 (+) Transcript_51920:208-846(+)
MIHWRWWRRNALMVGPTHAQMRINEISWRRTATWRRPNGLRISIGWVDMAAKFAVPCPICFLIKRKVAGEFILIVTWWRFPWMIHIGRWCLSLFSLKVGLCWCLDFPTVSSRFTSRWSLRIGCGIRGRCRCWCSSWFASFSRSRKRSSISCQIRSISSSLQWRWSNRISLPHGSGQHGRPCRRHMMHGTATSRSRISHTMRVVMHWYTSPFC